MTDALSFSRDADLRYIAERVMDGDCCALVGVSNVGKSYVLRAWQRPEVVRAYLGQVAAPLAKTGRNQYGNDGQEPQSKHRKQLNITVFQTQQCLLQQLKIGNDVFARRKQSLS